MKNIARTKEELMIEIHKLQRQVEDFQKSKDIRDKKLIKAIYNWQRTFDSISDSITLIDSKGIIQLCNKATLELLEKPVEKIVGSICWEAVHGTSEPIEKCPFSKMRQTHKRESKIMVVDDRLYEITVDPQLDERDNLIGGVHIISDITKRTKINEVLKENEEKYHSLFLKMLNGFALHEIVLGRDDEPEDYIFLEVNDEFEKQTGLKRENILEKNASQVIPGIEDDPANILETYGEVAKTGKEIKFEHYSHSLEKWFSILAYSPKKNQFATISEDITERKKAEEELN
ncbi:MAG: PAS domain-containing protein, partial [Candidatus Cloacimonetes bacterium]|nr:PAS domain-containing protein [Candidatus Cloacimonadota bacterium]